MEPWEIMISESQERMVAVVRPERLAEVEAVLDRWELHHARRSARSPRPASCARSSTAKSVGEIPAALLTDECPRYEVEQREARASRARSVDARQLRAEGRGSTSSTTSSSARARFGGRASTRRCCGCGRRAAGSPSRSTGRRSAAATRSSRARGRARRGAQRRLRRRRAARAHRLPQLRQSGEARDRLGAGAGDRGHRASGRGARDPGRLRQRLALQRDRRPRDPAHAGRRLRRPRARRARRCPRGWQRGDARLRWPRGDSTAELRRVRCGARAPRLFTLAHDVSDGGLAPRSPRRRAGRSRARGRLPPRATRPAAP